MNISLMFNVPRLLSWIWLIGFFNLCNVVHILCCFLNVLSFQHKFTIVGCDCLQFIVQKILLYFHISPRTSQIGQLKLSNKNYWVILQVFSSFFKKNEIKIKHIQTYLFNICISWNKEGNIVCDFSCYIKNCWSTLLRKIHTKVMSFKNRFNYFLEQKISSF